MAAFEDPVAVARSRAQRHLSQLVWAWALTDEELPVGLDREALTAQRETGLTEALVAFRDLGLLSDAETDEWRALSNAAQRTRTMTPPAESPPQAVRLLEELFADVGPLDEAAMHDHAALMRGSYGRFMGALTVASMTQSLSVKDADAWYRRLEDRVLADQSHAVRDEIERRRVSLAELERVIPGPARRSSGLTLVSLELYRDAFLVNWQRPFSRPRGDAEFRGPDFPETTVADDVGTEYFGHGGGGGTSGVGGVWRGHTVVVPAPPPGARTLTVRFDAEEEFAVDLDPAARLPIR